jgi:hypothetical protein
MRKALGRLFDKPRTITYTTNTGNVLPVGGLGYSHYVKVSSVMTIDSINTSGRFVVGRKIQLIGHPGNGDAITIRDNQGGSNLSIVGTSLTLGAHDSITFRAELDSSGNQIWAQDTPLVNL